MAKKRCRSNVIKTKTKQFKYKLYNKIKLYECLFFFVYQTFLQAGLDTFLGWDSFFLLSGANIKRIDFFVRMF